MSPTLAVAASGWSGEPLAPSPATDPPPRYPHSLKHVT